MLQAWIVGLEPSEFNLNQIIMHMESRCLVAVVETAKLDGQKSS